MYNRYIPREEAYRPVEEERPSGGAADFFQSLFHRQGEKNAGIAGILKTLKLDRLDKGDILLILLILYLYWDGSGDKENHELLLILALTLLLGL